MMIAEIIVWVSLSLVLYTYVVYAAILYIASKFKDHTDTPSELKTTPRVSIVFSAYNEAIILPEKIRNLKTIEYPEEQIEFVIGSDGSTDDTDRVLNDTLGPMFRILSFAERRGKAAVLNDLIQATRGEVIVFTDANTMFAPDTVRQLVGAFVDPQVGAVCGNLVLRSDVHTVGGVGESTYWNYENIIKQLESDLRTIFGGTGAVYAIRKMLYKPLPTATPVTDDLLIPLNILAAGYITKYEPKAVAFEKSENSIIREFRRKARIGAQNFYSLKEFVGLLNPALGFVAFGLWSHKIIRWLVPFFLLAAFGATLELVFRAETYGLLLGVEIAFVVLAVLGFILDSTKKPIGFLGIPYYILATNTALFIGFLRYVLKRERPMWEVNRL